MAGEVRNRYEGVLTVALGSGSGVALTTASATTPVIIGYVDNFTFTSAATITAVGDRGVPTHNKIVARAPINGNFTVRHTGVNFVPSAVSGASVPWYVMELRYSAPEAAGNPSAFYMDFMGVTLPSIQFTEGDLNQIQTNFQALAQTGWNTTGYLR